VMSVGLDIEEAMQQKEVEVYLHGHLGGTI
jgi:hypothetical protein